MNRTILLFITLGCTSLLLFGNPHTQQQNYRLRINNPPQRPPERRKSMAERLFDKYRPQPYPQPRQPRQTS